MTHAPQGLTKTNAIKTVIIIIAAFLAYGVVAGLRATTGVFTAEISTLSGISYGVVSDIATIRNVLFALSCPLWGFLTLRKSHTFIMIIGLILTACGFCGILVFPSLAGLIVFQGICFGLGAGALCYSIVYAAAAPFLSPKITALFAGILSMSQGTFNIIISPIVEMSSASGEFAICIILISVVIAAIIPITLFFKWQNHHRTAVENVSSPEYVSVKMILKTMVRSPFFYLLAISFFIYGLCDGEMVNHLYQRATVCMGLSGNTATFLVMLYGLALIIGPLLGGCIISKVKNKRLALATMFLLWSATITASLILASPSETGAIVITLLIGVFISMAVPFHATLIQERVPLKYFAPTFSLISSFPILGYAVNAMLGGLCFDLTGSFIPFDILVLGLACACGLAYLITGFRKQRKNTQL